MLCDPRTKVLDGQLKSLIDVDLGFPTQRGLSTGDIWTSNSWIFNRYLATFNFACASGQGKNLMTGWGSTTGSR
jgi:hypothetical protein